jgi:hypothetical protein
MHGQRSHRGTLHETLQSVIIELAPDVEQGHCCHPIVHTPPDCPPGVTYQKSRCAKFVKI